jgi:hypothetical protein
MDLRRLGLETLHQILQASGHTILVGWETIFKVLGSVCRFRPCFVISSFLTRPRAPRLISFTRTPASLHQHAWAVWSAGGHGYRPDGGGESLLERLGRDIDEAARGGP